MKKYIFILLIISNLTAKPPKFAIVFVIDQFAYHYLDKLYPHLNGGIKKMIDKSALFTQAKYPHAQPGTAAGHACLNTGTLPETHGIISNNWFDREGNKVFADQDPSSPVFSSNGLYDFGKSPKNLMVPGISDQALLHDRAVFGLSLKSRAAIAVSGKLGKAIWTENNNFTSSKAYFKALPKWIKKFNKKRYLKSSSTWDRAYSESEPYDFNNMHEYKYSDNGPLVDELITEENFAKTPLASKRLLDLANICIKKNIKDEMLIFISISNLDFIGHDYGPESIEAIDLIYHIDKQIANFMKQVESKVKKEDILYVLTSDHGVMKIPELLSRKGLPAKRLDPEGLINEANTFINQKYKVDNIVLKFRSPWFFLNEKKLNVLPDKNAILNDLKFFFQSKPGFRKVWLDHEFKDLNFEKHSIKSNFKTQRFSNRSGYITCFLHPYMYLSNYKKGTGHASPYNYDTHVPLMFYQSGKIEKQKINKPVWMPQFAPTLASILEIPKPIACQYHGLGEYLSKS